jgi:protein-S-isoprenylcysteine O-methyltransferase Ste14
VVLYVVYVVVVFAGRALLLRKQTGTAGWRGISGRPGSAAWWGGVLFALALVGGLAGAVLGAAGVFDQADRALAFAGVALYLVGAVASVGAQQAMGASWRVGVSDDEQTELVSTGLFGLARNPFFTALILTAAGLTIMVGNVVAVVSFAALVLAVELQVRVVEEPYLRRAHGERYERYATRVGRFVPGVGRLRTERAR